MNSSRVAIAKSITLTSLALVSGPVAVLLVAGSRGTWMWDNSSDKGPLWHLGPWLFEPRILGAIAFGVVLIALVETGGGARATRFRLAVRLVPVAFAVPVVMVALIDPILPRWLAAPITSWGTAADPRSLHEVVLTLATPVAFIGILLPALWIGTRRWSPTSLDSPWRKILLAVGVYVLGYVGATLCAPLPPISTLLGIPVAGLTLGLCLIPGLVISVWIWESRLPAGNADEGRPGRTWAELAALAGAGVLAFAGFNAMA